MSTEPWKQPDVSLCSRPYDINYKAAFVSAKQKSLTYIRYPLHAAQLSRGH